LGLSSSVTGGFRLANYYWVLYFESMAQSIRFLEYTIQMVKRWRSEKGFCTVLNRALAYLRQTLRGRAVWQCRKGKVLAWCQMF
jgi:hypothetical protein